MSDTFVESIIDMLMPGLDPARLSDLSAEFAAIRRGLPDRWGAAELAALAADPPHPSGRALRDVARRAGAAYYADEATWPSLGYRVLPPGERWPEPGNAGVEAIPLAAAEGSYDVIVVGSGAGGGVAAHVLTAAGLRVLVVERGRSWPGRTLAPDAQRNQRVYAGLPRQLDFPGPGNLRVVGDAMVDPGSPDWGGNASAVGGGTLVYGAQAWRFCPEDFRMGTLYGPEFPDWPIGYDDLEQYYDLVEHTVGVSGPDSPHRWEGPHRRGYPMPPVRPTRSGERLKRGAQTLGLDAGPVPMLINSRPFGGRPSCAWCAACAGFACPADAKNGAVHLLAAAQLSGVRIVAETVVRRLITERGDAVIGVEASSAGLTRSIRARHVVVAAGAVESARLLLLSGVGNRHDQVGRYVQGHPYVSATGVFGEPVLDLVGPGPSMAVTAYRHGNPGICGGGMLANDFVPPPVEGWLKLVAKGLAPAWGRASQEAMRELYPRTLDVVGPIQQAPQASSRITLASMVDGDGLAVARLHPVPLTRSDAETARFLTDRAAEWLSASGAQSVVRTPPDGGPMVSAGQHQAGTCRMGVDPGDSVTDPWGRVWGHRGVSVADGSLHVTNGGVNPVLTIMALAWRVAEAVADELA